jgi:aldehyde:ferredoxin oxidoreductase
VSAVTGWDFSYDEAYRVGRRIVHLLRAFNIKHGITGREFDKLSKRYGSAPDAGDGSGKSLEKVWDKMLDRYYDGMGWDIEGKPLPKTLRTYGLEHVSKDIWK